MAIWSIFHLSLMKINPSNFWTKFRNSGYSDMRILELKLHIQIGISWVSSIFSHSEDFGLQTTREQSYNLEQINGFTLFLFHFFLDFNFLLFHWFLILYKSYSILFILYLFSYSSFLFIFIISFYIYYFFLYPLFLFIFIISFYIHYLFYIYYFFLYSLFRFIFIISFYIPSRSHFGSLPNFYISF